VALRDGRAFLEAAYEAERWDILRGRVGTVLAFVSLPCWLMAAWPGFLGAKLRAVFLGLWGVFFALLVLSLVATHVWRRRCMSYRDARAPVSLAEPTSPPEPAPPPAEW
jgi:hypothetical protein